MRIAPNLRFAAALALAVGGCDDRPRPWSGAPDGGTIDESAPFLPGATRDAALGAGGGGGHEPAAPDPAPEPGRGRAGGLWASCHEGFRPEGEPARDATRLGLVCGPVNGMEREGELRTGEVAEGGTPDRLEIQVAAGACYRIVAVAAPAVVDLDVEAHANGVTLARDGQSGSWLVLEPDRPICGAGGPLSIAVTAERGAGSYALEIWRLSSR